MEQTNPPNSPTNHSQNSPTPNKEDEIYTNDGWTYKEDNIFEKLWYDFDGVASPAFFQQVAREIPGKSMNAIKIHYKNYMRDLDIINPFHGEVILGDEEYEEDEEVDDVS